MALKFAGKRADLAWMTVGEGFGGILAAAATGAEWACRHLYLDLSPTVCGYLRLQGAREPEDVTSEVFVSVFRGLRSFSGSEAEFRSWVFTIAHRRLVDERRRVAHQPRTVTLNEQDSLGGDVEEDALRRISADRVRSLCGTLAPDQRDVLLLRMVSALTVEQVGAVLDKTPGAVKALQRRGLAALRHVIDRKNLDSGVPL